MRTARRWCAGLALALAAPAAATGGQEPLLLNDINLPPFTNAQGTGFVDAVAREAFERAGLELRLVRLPAERGLRLANRGVLDGDVTRIGGLERRYPNLVRVPEPLLQWELVAFAKDPDLDFDLEAIRSLRVGYIRGWKIYDDAMAGAGEAVALEDAEQLFRLLQRDRIDVALFARWMGIAHVRAHGLSGIHALRPVLERREMYIYLHERHAAQAPRIAAALRELKRRGVYGARLDAALRGLAEPRS